MRRPMSTTEHSSADESPEPRPERTERTVDLAPDEKTVETGPTGAHDADPGVSRGLGEEDPHGFAAAFTGSMRSEADGAHGKSGRTILIGAGAVAAIAVGALVVGALDTGSSGPAKSTADAVAGGKQTVATATTPGHPASKQPSADAAAPATHAPNTDASSTAATSKAPAPSPAASTTAQTKGTVANATTFIFVGPDCSSPGNWYNEYTYYTGTNSNGTTGWTTQSGSYSGNGCTGAYMSMPMSGTSSETEHVLWKISTAPKNVPCTIEVYIPATTNITLVGGDPAQYTYALNGSDTQTSFAINQLANRGRWVAEATVKTTDGEVEVRLGNAGVDYDSSNWNAHDAVAAVALACAKS